MYKIGLTGSIGSGKSTVSKILVSQGIKVVDTDEISRNLTSDNSPILFDLKEAFGEDILIVTKDEITGETSLSLDRRRLAEIAFSSEDNKKLLTQIVTNRVKIEMWAMVNQLESEGETLVCCDIPLLFESNVQNQFDEIWSVVADDEIRFERANKRDGITKEDFTARDRSQISQEHKIKNSDVVFYNDSTLDELVKNVLNEVKRVKKAI